MNAKREIHKRRSEKIDDLHLDRLAVVYVRQSTLQQVLEHQESTRLQYGLVNRAEDLGWQRERVLVAVSWLHIQSLRSFFKVICQPEGTLQ
jgi:hypothetical protein